jgi:hypothetical protein
MTKSKLSKSTRQYVRREKARIRKESLPQEEKKKAIDNLYSKFSKKEKLAKSK